MKTASFFTYFGPGRISIARFAPRQIPKGYKTFRALAPGPWFNSVSKEEYERLFSEEVLGKLDPQAVWDQLHGLVEPHEPVLLCWERLDGQKPEEWCHRTQVAEWFEKKLGVTIAEAPHTPYRPEGQGELF